MSGYSGEPKKMQSTWVPAPTSEFGHNDAFITRKLHNDEICDPTSKKRAVERLAELAAVHGSVEAAANLALYMGLDLDNDVILREGILNGRKSINGVDERRNELIEQAKKCRDSENILGYTALAGIAGYFPPEQIDTL